MTLTELRTLFAARTGRLDLSDDDVLLLLNEASKLLDELEMSGKRTYRMLLALPANSQIIELSSSFRLSKDATQHTAGGAKTLRKIERKTLEGLVTGTLVNSLLTDVFSIIPGATAVDILNISSFPTAIGVQEDINVIKSYLLIHPVLAEDSLIELETSSYSFEFDDNYDEANYWSLKHPELLMQAVNYLLVKHLLNIDESTKILADLKERVMPISFDFYEEEDINNMEG